MAGFVLFSASLAAATALDAQGLKPASGLPGPKSGGAAAQAAGAAAMRADVTPAFDEEVLEMTPTTLDRFAKALSDYEAARKSIAAKANAPIPKATKTKDEYQQCQMQLMMSPEFQQMMQESINATTANANNPAKSQKAGQDMAAKMEAAVMKACGADPSKTYTKPDVGGQLRTAQADAAKANGLTDRQFSIIRERVTPFCFSDSLGSGAGGVKIKGDGPVYFVYSAGEAAALQPRCEAFTKAMYPNKR